MACIRVQHSWLSHVRGEVPCLVLSLSRLSRSALKNLERNERAEIFPVCPPAAAAAASSPKTSEVGRPPET